MKILMVSPYFYPEGGGAEFYMYKIAEKLSEQHEISVLCTKKQEKHPLSPNEKIKINTLKHDFRISTTPISLTLLKDIISFIKKE